MTTTIVLALAVGVDGTPAALLPTGDGPVVRRVVSAAGAHGEVVVLTRAAWREAVAAALDAGREGGADGEASDGVADGGADGGADGEASDGVADGAAGGVADGGERSVEVRGLNDGPAVLEVVAALLAAAPGVVSIVHGHLLSDPVGLAPLLDEYGGTTVLVRSDPRSPGAVSGGPGAHEPGASALRTIRGRVVAASSPLHRVSAPSDRAVGALQVAVGGSDAAVAGLRELAEALRSGALPSAAPATSTSTQSHPGSAASGPPGPPDTSGMRCSATLPDASGDRLDPHASPADASRATSMSEGARNGASGSALAEGSGEFAAGDGLACALVALVRGGVPVTPRPVPAGGVAELVTARQQAHEVAVEVAALDLAWLRRRAAVKSDDGFFTTFLVSSWSPWVAILAARLGLSPDAVTWLSMAFGILAAAAFAVGGLPFAIAGALLLQWAFVLDCVDGQLARFTRRFSARGAWLDAMFDRGKEYLVYAGLAVGGVRAGADATLWLLAGSALALQTFRHTLDLGYAAQQSADVDRVVRRSLLDPSDVGPSFWEVGHASAPDHQPGVPVASAGDASEPQDVAEVSGRVGPRRGDAPQRRSGGTSTPSAPAAPAAPGPPPPPVLPQRQGLPRRAILALRTAERIPVLKWAKRIVILPIGERFALLSILAVTTSPRTTFLVLLTWSLLATLYTAGGRVVRSLA